MGERQDVVIEQVGQQLVEEPHHQDAGRKTLGDPDILFRLQDAADIRLIIQQWFALNEDLTMVCDLVLWRTIQPFSLP